jgi:hypothetical protein
MFYLQYLLEVSPRFCRALFKKLNLKGEIMKAIKDLLKHCMDKNNPKPELDGILIDGNKLVCTDTKQLLILTFKESFQASKNDTTMLFDKIPRAFEGSPRPKNFIKILDANQAIIDALGFKVCVPTRESGSPAKFPDYKRVSEPKNKNAFRHAHLDFDDCENSDDLLIFKSTILNNSPFDGRFLTKFAQLLVKTHFSFSGTICQSDANTPLITTFNVKEIGGHVTPLIKIEYVCMPIIINEKDRQVA